MLYLYILKCRDNSYYTGVTNNLNRRITEHNEGISPKSYTYSRRPVTLIFSEIFENPLDAIQVEKQVKGWSRKKKEALIAGQFDLLQELAKCKNETTHKNFNGTE